MWGALVLPADVRLTPTEFGSLQRRWTAPRSSVRTLFRILGPARMTQLCKAQNGQGGGLAPTAPGLSWGHSRPDYKRGSGLCPGHLRDADASRSRAVCPLGEHQRLLPGGLPYDLCHCSRVSLTSCLCHTLASTPASAPMRGAAPGLVRPPALPVKCPGGGLGPGLLSPGARAGSVAKGVTPRSPGVPLNAVP